MPEIILEEQSFENETSIRKNKGNSEQQTPTSDQQKHANESETVVPNFPQRKDTVDTEINTGRTTYRKLISQNTVEVNQVDQVPVHTEVESVKDDEN